MDCATLKTRCRLCGAFFKEYVCVDENGHAWVDKENGSMEDGNPWCSSCLERINRTCEVLCADVSIEL